MRRRKRAGHFSCIASVPGALTLLAGEGARDPAGFDRDAFRGVMNHEILGFSRARDCRAHRRLAPKRRR
jgi:hypothetical protein